MSESLRERMRRALGSVYGYADTSHVDAALAALTPAPPAEGRETGEDRLRSTLRPDPADSAPVPDEDCAAPPVGAEGLRDALIVFGEACRDEGRRLERGDVPDFAATKRAFDACGTAAGVDAPCRYGKDCGIYVEARWGEPWRCMACGRGVGPAHPRHPHRAGRQRAGRRAGWVGGRTARDDVVPLLWRVVRPHQRALYRPRAGHGWGWVMNRWYDGVVSVWGRVRRIWAGDPPARRRW